MRKPIRMRWGRSLTAWSTAALLVALGAAGAPRAGEEPKPAGTAPAPAASAAAAPAAPAPAPKADPAALEPLAFMAGCWEGEQEGTKAEECWLTPEAGLMVGMHRDVFKNGKTMFEFLRIEAQATGVVYLASPRGAPATPFSLTRAAGGRAEFINPTHDYPQRILYWADGRDKLKAAVEGNSGGKVMREEWTWTRRK